MGICPFVHRSPGLAVASTSLAPIRMAPGKPWRPGPIQESRGSRQFSTEILGEVAKKRQGMLVL